MSVPTHGYGCQTTKSYKTNCKHCHNTVIYFECSCGSKVFLENGVPHNCGVDSSPRRISFDKLRDEDLRHRNKEESLKIIDVLRGNRKSLEILDTPSLSEYNGLVVNRLAKAISYQYKCGISLDEISLLWAYYLYSLESYNLCGNCQKPVKVNLIKPSSNKVIDKSINLRNMNTTQFSGEILAHFQISDRTTGKSVFKPSLEFVKPIFIRKHPIYNQKCDCLFRSARKNGNIIEEYIASVDSLKIGKDFETIRGKIINCELCNATLFSNTMSEHLRRKHTTKNVVK